MIWSKLWSSSVMQMIASLQYSSASPGTTCFPPSRELSSLDANSSYSAFVNLIKILPRLSDHWGRILLNQNCLALCTIEWNKTDIISSFSLQVYVSNKNIEDLCLCERNAIGKNPKAFYYRYDCHPKKLGSLFKEPILHFHDSNWPSLRTPFPLKQSNNPIIDFLELIYINHFYNDWFDWAKKTCEPKGLLEPLNILSNLFNASDLEKLSSNENLLSYQRIKDLLYGMKSDLFNWKLEPNYLNAFTYWS